MCDGWTEVGVILAAWLELSQTLIMKVFYVLNSRCPFIREEKLILEYIGPITPIINDLT
jgi:hypothetical protein